MTRRYEGFVECVCKTAVAVFNLPSLKNMYDVVQPKIVMFIETWNLGDEQTRVIHREERKQVLNSPLK